ncbi:hypothetical protein ABZ357_37320 [Streptomyces sp. NPDC005917]|uniref:hypothetical protein n=1 Tax=unclassified Streptomyces TaxID=2593676 RepID=UPI0033EF03BC
MGLFDGFGVRLALGVLGERPVDAEHETLLNHLCAGASGAFSEALRAHLAATHGSPGSRSSDR